MTEICGLVVTWDGQAAQVMRLRFMLMFFFPISFFLGRLLSVSTDGCLTWKYNREKKT